tara:strand:+ start:438 stop:695 length:258 start_codon:yes stop_codon:yes gene_type:complete
MSRQVWNTDTNAWDVFEDDSPAISLSTEKISMIERVKRDRLLIETDWWAMSDLTMTDAQTTYRQALRDVPEQSGFPNDITWPTKP